MGREPYNRRLDRLRTAWGGRCVWCGAHHLPPVWFLEFCHLPGKVTGLDGRGRGSPQRWADVRKNPQSYVLLCRDCHAKLDGRGGGKRERKVAEETRREI